jgi:hypothetical protein
MSRATTPSARECTPSCDRANPMTRSEVVRCNATWPTTPVSSSMTHADRSPGDATNPRKSSPDTKTGYPSVRCTLRASCSHAERSSSDRARTHEVEIVVTRVIYPGWGSDISGNERRSTRTCCQWAISHSIARLRAERWVNTNATRSASASSSRLRMIDVVAPGSRTPFSTVAAFRSCSFRGRRAGLSRP